jgi:hypothetical protein
MTPLAKLTIGLAPTDGPLRDVLVQLQQNLEEFENTLIRFMHTPGATQEMRLFAPYSCRTLLETALTILIARVDPVRVLFLREHQNSNYYTRNSRNKSAIQWSGDIYPKDKGGQELWAYDIEKSSAWRAMLGDWYVKLIFEPGIEKLGDVQRKPASDWLIDLLKVEKSGIGQRLRGDAEQLYSELSKSVHAEYVIARATIVDDATIKTYIERTFKLLGEVALICHFSKIFHCSLTADEALDAFVGTEGRINGPTT